jgi:hypothetical protein
MTRLRTQPQIVKEIFNGTPPPLLSRECNEVATKLGAGLTFENACSTQSPLSPKKRVDDLQPPVQSPAAPDDAFALHVGKAPAPPAPSANGALPAMEFKSATTNHGGNVSAPETPSLMSERGKKLASRTAPKSVF